MENPKVDLDQDFLYIDIDSIPDVPPLEPPPYGVYELSVQVSPKVIQSKKDGKTYKLIEFSYKVLGTIEKLDNRAEEAIPGQMFSIATSLDPERLKWHKETIKSLLEISGTKTLNELFKVPQIRIIATVTRKSKPDNPGEYYANVSHIQAA